MDILNWLSALPNAVAQGFVWGIMAIGVYITFKILDIADLTVDGTMALGGAVCAVAVTSGLNIWLSIALALIAGCLAGFLTGIFHTTLGIPAILSGILTQLMLWSVNLVIMGKANIAVPYKKYHLLIAQLDTVKSLLVLGGVLVVIIAALYWFFGTELGSSLRATGNNINMSRAQGINTNFTKVLGLALSNGIVALAGAFLAQFSGAADINMGRGAIVIGLAAIIIGESIVSVISQNFMVRLFGVVLGSVIYWFVYQTVIFLGLPADYLKMLSALVVALFLGIPYVKKTYFHKKKKAVKKDA